MADKLRLDKWLWAARFYKTRSLAAHEVGKGRVLVNGQPAKPARDVAVDDLVSIRKEDPAVHVWVRALSSVRGPAPGARQLSEDTPDRVAARQPPTQMRPRDPHPAP